MGKAKTDLIKIRVQAEEKEAFQEASELAGIALSAWVRERLRDIAKRELSKSGRKVAFLRSSK